MIPTSGWAVLGLVLVRANFVRAAGMADHNCLTHRPRRRRRWWGRLKTPPDRAAALAAPVWRSILTTMFSSIKLSEFDSPQALVVAKFSDSPIDAYVKKFEDAAAIIAASARTECSGDLGKIAEAYPLREGGPTRIIIVGLGKKDKFKASDLRTAMSVVARRIAVTRDVKVMLAVSGPLGEVKADLETAGRCAGEAFGLLGWDSKQFKGKKAREDDKRVALELSADKKSFRNGIEFGLALAESTNYARTLSETPPNIATPQFIADLAKKMAKQLGLSCTVMDEKTLEKEEMVGHINVGKASENKPRMIRLAYTPEVVKKGKEKPVVLIGKTMTYDTGGLSLKVNNGMVGMKRDKDGGCAVLAAMHAIATVIKPKRPVVAILCSAENSISDEAYRPDDVLTYRNGVTVEITNTDAEGRLVLADGLIWACEKENPAYIVDLATLTGGVVVALGSTFCGMFCEDDTLRGKIEAAAAASGERVWRLPMHDEYRDMMKSPIADILNSNPNRKAHPVQGAAFLSYFVKPEVPWCHLDIAGVHASESDSGMFVKGPTGWGTRLLADLLSGE